MDPRHTYRIKKFIKVTIVACLVALSFRLFLDQLMSRYVEVAVSKTIERNYVQILPTDWEAQKNYVIEGTYNYPHKDTVRMALVSDYERRGEWALKLYIHDKVAQDTISDELDRLRQSSSSSSASNMTLHKMPDRIESDESFLIWYIDSGEFDAMTRMVASYNSSVDNFKDEGFAYFDVLIAFKLMPLIPFLVIPLAILFWNPIISVILFTWFFLSIQISLKVGKKRGLKYFIVTYAFFSIIYNLLLVSGLGYLIVLS